MTNHIDLHIHTTASDGTCAPGEVVHRAVAAGVRVMAVTDHDTVAGVKEAMAEGARLGITVVPGIEISSDYNGEDTHILGYGVDPDAPAMAEVLEWIVAERDRRNEQIAALMRADGVEVDIARLKARYPGATVGRPHFARALVDCGRANSVPEAFQNWLNTGKPYYLPRNQLPFARAMEFIHRAGGIAVLAHPLQYGYPPAELRALVARAAQCGAEGMEIYYSGYTGEDRVMLEELAAEFGLFGTGGSDFHGENRPAVRLGALEMPESVEVELMRRLAR